MLELDSSVQNRVLLGRVAWHLFLDHPLLGVGAGNYAVHFYEYADEVGSTALDYNDVGGTRYPHSLYLELASETGFLGLITFGTMILLVFGHLRRTEEAFFTAGNELHAALASALALALLAFLISSLFLHGHFQRYLWVLLGLSAALAAAAPAVTDAGSLAGSRPTREEWV
jgi:O-antigen ligase